MTRRARIHYPGAVYHVMLRGNAGEDIFFDDSDRLRFYDLLQEGVKRFDVRIAALCLMSNHVHLVVQVGEIPLSRLIQNVSFRYTRYRNARQRRTGHLFQGRYKALLIDAETYLPELVRYIHLNPVRAGIVGNPEDYRWSSHRAYLGKEVLPWLSTDWILSRFSSRKGTARRLFRNFVADGIGGDYREEFHSGTREGRILGDDDFAEGALRRAGEKVNRPVSMEEIITHVCTLYGLGPEALAEPGKKRYCAEARAVIALLVWYEHHLSLTDLCTRLGRDLSSLSRAVNRLRTRAEANPRLAAQLEKVRGDLR
ncbi:MAG: transposase [Pseudomonadota bacterium]